MTDVRSGAFSAGFGQGTASQRYQLIDLLHTGGMGRIHKALDTQMQRLVVIKRSRSDVLDAEVRLRREGRCAAMLFHPGIAPVLDAQRDDEGLFLVFPWMNGHDFSSLVGRREDALTALLGVCDAMAHAHAKGVVHRDLKPSNIMLHDGRPIVIDWGLARVDNGTLDVRLTRTGLALGTPGFMSPEQAAGAATDKRADVWALGALMALALTGKAPDPSYWLEASAAPALPAGPISDLCTRCLAVDPNERPQDASEVHAALSLLMRPTPRSTWPWVALCGLAISALCLAIVGLYGRSTPLSAEAVDAMVELGWREARSGHDLAARRWHDRAEALTTAPALVGLTTLPAGLDPTPGLDLSQCHSVSFSHDASSILCLSNSRQSLLSVTDGQVQWTREFPNVLLTTHTHNSVLMHTESHVIEVSRDGSQRDLGYLRAVSVMAAHDDQWIIHNGADHGVATPQTPGPLIATRRSNARTNFVWNTHDNTWWVGSFDTVLKIDPSSGDVLMRVPHGLGEDVGQLLATEHGILAMGIRSTYTTLSSEGQPSGVVTSLPQVGLLGTASTDGQWLVTNGPTSGVQVWEQDTGAHVRQLQTTPARDVHVHEGTVLLGNESLFVVPITERPWAWHLAGLSRMSASDHGIVGTGDGWAVTFDATEHHHHALDDMGVVKAVVPWSNGWIAVGTGPPRVLGDASVPTAIEERHLRDMVAMTDGWMVANVWTGGPLVFKGDQLRTEFERPNIEYTSMVASADHSRIGLTTSSGEVEMVTVIDGEPSKQRIGHFPTVARAVPLPSETWLVMKDGDVQLTTSDTVLWSVGSPVTVVEVTDSLVFMGTQDGRVQVRDHSGELVAELRAHEERLSSLAVHGSDLYTGSWDGWIRRFNIASL